MILPVSGQGEALPRGMLLRERAAPRMPSTLGPLRLHLREQPLEGVLPGAPAVQQAQLQRVQVLSQAQVLPQAQTLARAPGPV